jgi:vacuolar protein sorting-associated protein 35
VFPDEFHLQTLETLLAVCPQMQSTVKVGSVLAGLMSRLAKYAADVPDVCLTLPRCGLCLTLLQVVPQFQAEDAFGKFGDTIAKVIEAQPDIATVDIVAMYSSLMMFALQVHREQFSYVDVVLAGCANALASRGMVSEQKVRQLHSFKTHAVTLIPFRS